MLIVNGDFIGAQPLPFAYQSMEMCEEKKYIYQTKHSPMDTEQDTWLYHCVAFKATVN
jgi:hypothetical protein